LFIIQPALKNTALGL